MHLYAKKKVWCILYFEIYYLSYLLSVSINFLSSGWYLSNNCEIGIHYLTHIYGANMWPITSQQMFKCPIHVGHGCVTQICVPMLLS